MGIYDFGKRQFNTVKRVAKKAGTKTKDALLGETAADVDIPESVQQAQDQRQTIIDRLMAQTAQPSTAAQDAVRQEGRLLSDRAAAQAASQAAGARGVGALAARRSAGAQNAAAQSRIAGQVAAGAGRAVAQDEQSQRADTALAGQILAQDEQSAIALEQWREQQRKKGLLGVALGAGGAAAGSYFGGAQGGQAGAQIGYGVGQELSR